MLVESDVVESVCNYLGRLGYEICQRLPPTKRGVDIIASRPHKPQELWIEAKGETSERESSKRYGEPFDSAQVHIHVAEAVYTAIKHLAAIPAAVDRAVAIALPDNDLHKRYAGNVMPILLKLGIVILWVGQDKSVAVYPEEAIPPSPTTRT